MKKVGKAAAAADAAVANARANEEASTPSQKGKGSNAPRARKHNYGITDSARIEVIVADEKIPALRGDLTGDLTAIGTGCTVAEFKAKGGTRHGLRVLMRRSIIQLVHEDGTRYPMAYVAPAPKAKAPAAETTDAA